MPRADEHAPERSICSLSLLDNPENDRFDLWPIILQHDLLHNILIDAAPL